MYKTLTLRFCETKALTNNAKQFVDNVASKLKIKALDDWYKVSKQVRLLSCPNETITGSD